MFRLIIEWFCYFISLFVNININLVRSRDDENLKVHLLKLFSVQCTIHDYYSGVT